MVQQLNSVALLFLEGPKMFCRSINLEEERERWEDSRSLLIEVSIFC